MRFGKYRSDEKILHDEYFSDQPSAAFLLTARLVLLCLMSASFVTIFCDLYGYEGMGYIPAAVAAAASGALYILASVLPAPIIYGAVAAAIAGIGWVLREKVILLSTYLWDYLLMKLDSRLLHTTEYLIHSPAHTINAGPADIMRAVGNSIGEIRLYLNASKPSASLIAEVNAYKNASLWVIDPDDVSLSLRNSMGFSI